MSQQGFTLLEMMIAVAIISLLMVSALSIATDTSMLAADNQVQYDVQAECNRTFDRFREFLQPSGVSVDEYDQEYPALDEDGNFIFRLPEEGDGEIFWEAEPYIVLLKGSTAGVYSEDELLRVLGNLIKTIELKTVKEDNTLQPNEVRLRVVTEKQSRGELVSYERTSTIFMRN